MKLQIIVHNWRYSRVQMYQLSSLVLHKPILWDDVIFTIFHAHDDKLVIDMMDFFDDKLTIERWPLDLPSLQRREIGRNLAALEAEGDFVWFADADYVFGVDCLDTLYQQAIDFQDDRVYFPPYYFYNGLKNMGDWMAGQITEPAVVDIDKQLFMPIFTNRAIGGLQIVTGTTARMYGYCPDDPRVQNPVSNGKWVIHTLGDVKYRRTLKAARNDTSGRASLGMPVHLPNLYRIRQSEPTVVDTLPSDTGRHQG